jgi:hypothetical protein
MATLYCKPFLRPKLKAKSENFIFYRAVNCARTGSSCINIREISVRFDKQAILQQ